MSANDLPLGLVLTATETKALALLGQGFSPVMVATTIGLSESRLSQLLAQDEFANAVAEARYKNLASQTERDGRYDKIEDQLLERLEKSLGMLFDPMKIAKLIQVVNGAKRRGASAPEHLVAQQTVVQLNLPVQILQQFTVNSANQVVKAGQQDLITIQSGSMTKLLDSTKQATIEAKVKNLLDTQSQKSSEMKGPQDVQFSATADAKDLAKLAQLSDF